VQSQTGVGNRYDFPRTWLEAAYADLNNDQVEDVLLPAQRAPGETPLDLRAFSGTGGQTIWSFPLPELLDPRQSFGNVPPAAAGDLDGDDQPEVIVMSLTEGVTQQGASSTIVRVHALDGTAGRVRWQWETPADRWSHEIDHDADLVKNRTRPFLVRRADGKQWLAVAVWQKARGLHVLDERGRVVSKISVEQSSAERGMRVWPIDADGDGGDELIFLTEDSLALLPPDRLDQPIWERPERRSQFNRVLGVLPDPSASGRIVVMGGSRDYSLRGVEPATGRFEWTCVGPVPASLHATEQTAVLLNSPRTELPPHAIYQYQDQSLVRRGLPLSGALSDWRTFARPAPTLATDDYDPRLLRPLPWTPQDYELREMPALLGWAVFYGVTLAAIPVLTAGWMIRRRQWGLTTMLMLPVVVGIVLTAAMTTPENLDLRSLSNKVLFAFFAAGPVIFALAKFAIWLWQGRWRRVVLWVSLTLLSGFVIMAVILLFMEPNATAALQPGERYAWDGWYFMFLPMLYLMCWALMVLVGATWMIRAARRWLNDRGFRKLSHGTCP
jgi:hypothetical protein